MHKILGLVFLLFLFSCKEKAEEINKDEVRAISSMVTNYDTLIDKVKKHGDTDAYDELFYSFKDCCFDESTDSVMVYSKIMAEKYNYEKAYFDYFQAVCYKYSIDYSNFPQTDISKMNKQAKQKTEDWLKIMAEKKLITQQDFETIKR
jgi:hypothetical protein